MLILMLFGITIFLSYTLEFDFPTNDNGIYFKDLQLQSQEYFDSNYYYDKNYELDLDQNYYDDNGLDSRGIPIPMASKNKNCTEELRIRSFGERYPSMYLEILCTEVSSETEGLNRREIYRTCKRQDCKSHYKSLQLFRNKSGKRNNPCWEPDERVYVSVGCGCGSEF